jgi:hypothetical protein
MSGTFNGYHVWLGIPPDEQPPNHYRLLGITPFETDLDVIEHAADRQMAHVRTFQSGRHGALSQQILNELAAARLCLLSPDKKSIYDRELRAKTSGSAKSSAVPIGKAVPVAKAVPLARPVAKPQPSSRVSEPSDDMALDLDAFPANLPSGGPPFQMHVKRRKYNQASAGKNAAILGVLMAIVVITGLSLFFFVRSFLASSDIDLWQVLGFPGSSATSPSETPAAPPAEPASPPPPVPQSGQPSTNP